MVVSQPAVPAIANFRFLEVPTVLSGSRGMIVCLAQRPNNLIVGATLYFDTDPAGTFSSLGILPNFAAKATLSADVAATDGTLAVTVDTTQPDADYFTQQFSANQAQNDTMLAFLVDVSAGQVAESGGYQVMEICSVGTQALTSAGHYTLTVLRGRKNTTPAAFAAASTEVWLVPASLLSFFTHQLFDQIRANRLAGTTPAYAQFRLCPYTFVNSLPLSSAATFAFQFPLKSASAPVLTLTTPSVFSLNYPGNTTWPINIPVAGFWTDAEGVLVQHTVALSKSTEAQDRIVLSASYPNAASKNFATNVQIEAAGNYLIKLIARDSNNLLTERDIAVTVTGSGAKCALPQLFDSAGKEVVDYSGTPQASSNGSGNGSTGHYQALVQTNSTCQLGAMSLACATPNATIHFSIYTGGAIANTINRAGEISVGAADNVYSPDVAPYLALYPGYLGSIHTLATPAEVYPVLIIFAWATAPGVADSDTVQFQIPVLAFNF